MANSFLSNIFMFMAYSFSSIKVFHCLTLVCLIWNVCAKLGNFMKPFLSRMRCFGYWADLTFLSNYYFDNEKSNHSMSRRIKHINSVDCHGTNQYLFASQSFLVGFVSCCLVSIMFRKLHVKKYKTNFQQFADGTSMHGFTEFYYAKSTIWQCFWLITILAAIAVTIFQVAEAVSQYLNQKTTTSVQVATSEDIIYPPLRLCYPHWLYWFDWNKATEMNFTYNRIIWALSL